MSKSLVPKYHIEGLDRFISVNMSRILSDVSCKEEVRLRRAVFLVIPLILCLVIPSLSIIQTNNQSVTESVSLAMAEVWSDDFEDGNLDGWVTMGWNRTDSTPNPANFSVDEGVLIAEGAQESVAVHTFIL